MPEKETKKKAYRFQVRMSGLYIWLTCDFTPEELEGASKFSRILVNASPDKTGLSIVFLGYIGDENEK